MDSDKQKKVDSILNKIDYNLTRYPNCADKPEQDRYYGTSLILTKSEILIVKEALENLTTDSHK
jgi:hypothetical protein